MQFPTFHPSFLYYFFTSSYNFTPVNYVRWIQTPQSHIYSAQLPGWRKEDIKVEVEESIYLIIRTVKSDESTDSAAAGRSFMRKFQLPGMIDIDGISAGYDDGVLTVPVPKRGFYIDPADIQNQLQLVARAA